MNTNGGFDKKVLSYPVDGNFIAGRAKVSIYIGHVIQTPDYFEKLKKSENFYEGKFNKTQRKKFIENENICYIYVGSQERESLKINMENEDYLAKVFSENGIEVYKSKYCKD